MARRIQNSPFRTAVYGAALLATTVAPASGEPRHDRFLEQAVAQHVATGMGAIRGSISFTETVVKTSKATNVPVEIGETVYIGPFPILEPLKPIRGSVWYLMRKPAPVAARSGPVRVVFVGSVAPAADLAEDNRDTTISSVSDYGYPAPEPAEPS